jgi:phosphopantothenoylcysteine decarboxylase / phosphopantothenate---cysteine ligase
MGRRTSHGNSRRSFFTMNHSNDCRVLITAGPTHEPIDAVRYLGNRSSGRMGVALAEAAAARGWQATLLLGPTALPPPPDGSHLTVVRFQTTADLQALLRDHWPRHDLLIMAAAVADYRPRASVPQTAAKIKRGSASFTLELEPTPDLLAELAAVAQPRQTLVGFALEPAERLLPSAREKLAHKRLHAIVANPLETMDSPTITATVLCADGRVLTPPADMPKAAFARWLLDQRFRS